MLSPALRSRLNTPIATLLITALLYAAYLGIYIRHHQARTSYLVRIGGKFAHYGPIPGSPFVHPNIPGYDGVFFYRFALNPFTTKQIDYGIEIDGPAYRQQRIVYPILARILALGRPREIARAMLLTNYLAICALGWFGGVYAREKGQHALWGLAMTLTASSLMVIVLDTSELLSIVFVVLAMRCLDVQRFGLGALWCTLAVLTRESTLLLPMAALAAIIGPRFLPGKKQPAETVKPSVALLLLPFAVYLLWGKYLHHVWRHYPWDYNAGRVGLPFRGITGLLQTGVAMDMRPYCPVGVFHVEYIVGFAVLGLLALRSSTASLTIKLYWAALALMAMSYTYPMIYCLDMDYFRVLTDFFTVGALIFLASPDRWKLAALTANLVVALSIATDHIYNRW